MSPLKCFIILLCLLPFAILTVTGCSEENPDNVFSADRDEGHYQINWTSERHARAALNNLDTCADCHGSDYSGGIAKHVCTECHLGNELSTHPLEWGGSANVKHAYWLKQNGLYDNLLSCNDSLCHGADWRGGTGTAPNCATQCHIGNVAQKHPVSDIVIWAEDATYADSHAVYVQTKGILSCSNEACHGQYLEGVRESGMSCLSCHIQNW